MTTSAAGDTDDLEALFDSIVSATNVADAPPPPPAPAAPVAVAAAAPAPVALAPEAASPAPAAPSADEATSVPLNEPYYSQIGHLTRKLHDTMRELGLDKSLERAIDNTIPDARDRLAYIAQMTEQAAKRVLDATDVAKPMQDQLESGANTLSGKWDRLFANELSIDEFKALVTDTRGFLGNVSQNAKATNSQLTEIMMAQDFQDLTGQVIKKIIEMAKEMENQLVTVLIESAPAEKKAEAHSELLNGPVIKAEGRNDIVTSQEQVDDLLESLGF